LIPEVASERRSGLRIRGLAVGSSLLPWAHHQLAATSGPVKGLLGLGSAAVSSRDARSPFVPPTPKPDIAAPSAEPPRDDGGADTPAGAIGKPPGDGNSGGLNAGGDDVGAPNGARPHKLRPRFRQHPHPHARALRRPARVSAQPGDLHFFPAIGRAVKSPLPPLVAARARSFAAPPAVKPCGACSSGNGDGDSGPTGPTGHDLHPRATGPELVVRYRPRPHLSLRFLRPPEGGRGGRVPGVLRAPLPFSDPPPETGR